MTTMLAWDQVGSRYYQSGIDRGVLYLPNGTAVPWSGLVSISENTEREVKEFFLDGIKYLDHHVPGSYSAKLGAFTYPDELDELLGTSQFAPGVFVHDQRTQLFNLSYRTLEGNDLDGASADYKIHVVYNILAVPSSAGFSSLSDSPVAALFEWSLSGTPAQMFGIRPTSHISLHSRTIDPIALQDIENVLYGRAYIDEEHPEITPSLPTLFDLLAMIPTDEDGGS
jgi:hypothetical protein